MPVDIKIEKNTLYFSAKGKVIHYDGESLLQRLQDFFNRPIKSVQFDVSELESWDSSFLLLVFEVVRLANEKGIKYSLSALPQNVQDLILLAFAVDRKPSKTQSPKKDFLENGIWYHGTSVYGLQSILNKGITKLYNVPNIHDTSVMIEILKRQKEVNIINMLKDGS